MLHHLLTFAYILAFVAVVGTSDTNTVGTVPVDTTDTDVVELVADVACTVEVADVACTDVAFAAIVADSGSVGIDIATFDCRLAWSDHQAQVVQYSGPGQDTEPPV